MTYTIIRDLFDLNLTVRLHPGEGTVASDTIQLRVGSEFVNPNVDPPEGLRLDGWYKDSEFSNKANPGDIVDSTFANLYAKFKSVNFVDYVVPNSSGTYFDTRIVPSATTYFELDFLTPSKYKQSGNWPVLLGAQSYDGYDKQMFIRYGTPSIPTVNVNYFVQYTNWPNYYDINYDERHKIKFGPNMTIIDGVSQEPDTFKSVTTTNTVYMFAGNYGYAWRPQQFHCYGLKIWDGDNLIADFKPYIDTDGNGAFYEEVTGEIRYASGAMTAGND